MPRSAASVRCVCARVHTARSPSRGTDESRCCAARVQLAVSTEIGANCGVLTARTRDRCSAGPHSKSTAAVTDVPACPMRPVAVTVETLRIASNAAAEVTSHFLFQSNYTIKTNRTAQKRRPRLRASRDRLNESITAKPNCSDRSPRADRSGIRQSRSPNAECCTEYTQHRTTRSVGS